MAAEVSYHSYPGSPAPSLIQAVKVEDPHGWERPVGLFGALVCSWCRRAGLGREDLADVVQEVFQSIHRGIASFQRRLPGRSFRAWIKKITANKIRDLARRNARQALSPSRTRCEVDGWVQSRRAGTKGNSPLCKEGW